MFSHSHAMARFLSGGYSPSRTPQFWAAALVVLTAPVQDGSGRTSAAQRAVGEGVGSLHLSEGARVKMLLVKDGDLRAGESGSGSWTFFGTVHTGRHNSPPPTPC